MKQLVVSTLLILSCYAHSQENSRIYLDSSLEKTEEGKHTYYRTISQDEEGFLCRTFYLSGKIYQQGRSVTESGQRFHGWVREFWENGNRKSQMQYDQGIKVGSVQRWYEDGKQRLVGYWENQKGEIDNTLMVANFWNSHGEQTVINGNGFYSDDFDNLSEAGELVNERKNGVWKGSDAIHKIKFEETYADGKLVTGFSIDENGAGLRYDKIMEGALFPGGLEAFYRFVQKNFRTPDDAPGGRIIVSFHVDADGDISDLKAYNCEHLPTQHAIIDLFVKCPKFIPATMRGRAVKCFYTLPIVIAMP